jgi:hypothetical protein
MVRRNFSASSDDIAFFSSICFSSNNKLSPSEAVLILAFVLSARANRIRFQASNIKLDSFAMPSAIPMTSMDFSLPESNVATISSEGCKLCILDT